MNKVLLYFVFPFFIFSCSAKKKYRSNPILAQKLYEEGRASLSERIHIQGTDSLEAIRLNKEILKKFEAAYNADTANINVLRLASECTMYERDYVKCLYWTLKLVQKDTTNSNKVWICQRIADCYAQTGELSKSKLYYERAASLGKKSNIE